IEELCNIIPSNIRNKVYCMHINNRELINIIEKEGFNLVKVEES
ncbi:MAG TPA: MBL fold metallo-hydrolase, partial [Firmicutes bacterium]|nr:MBL fold metallo-hydrolase [Bacillota bacterium]